MMPPDALPALVLPPRFPSLPQALFTLALALAVFLPTTSCTTTTTTTTPTAVLCDATTRFVVLTARVIRAEYAADGRFVDAPSQTFPHSQSPQPPATPLPLPLVPTPTPPSSPHVAVANTTEWCNITVTSAELSQPTIVAYRHAPVPPSPPPPGACAQPQHPQTDAVCAGPCARIAALPHGTTSTSADACCSLCAAHADCAAWVHADSSTVNNTITVNNNLNINCWLLAANTVVGSRRAAGRTLGWAAPGNSSSHFAQHQLQVVGANISWTAAADRSSALARSLNLNGTLLPTPSADLAGCCANPDAAAGVFDPAYPLDTGLLSLAGLVAIDDSQTPLMANGTGDFDDGWPSPQPRAAAAQDLYLFACGRDYAGCLQDYVAVAGGMALPPLDAFGIWWSRHWGDSFDGNPFGPMSAAAIEQEVVAEYRNRSLPLHVVVLDMEWHSMLAAPGCRTFIGKKGWGGYSWNTTLFPDVGGFVAGLHASNIQLALNFHPDEGIDACQTHYADMARALGVDPGTQAMLPDLNPMHTNKTYADAYFTYMIEPTLVDYPWTDSPQVTMFSNYLYSLYPARRKGRRVLNFSRYGGLGSHRAPIGFSGDTLRKWDTLAFEVYMTPRAANVAFGYWSHDIGGFSGSYVDAAHHTEPPELFLRWLQFAAFSPIFRTHCRYCEQRIWTWGPDWFARMRQPMLLRNALVPYIYTHAALQSWGRGAALLRPMYWAPGAAAEPAAFDLRLNTRQYLFGLDFVVAPITSPASGPGNTTEQTLWLPPGEVWLDWDSSAVLGAGPRTHTASFGLEQTPAAVRQGAVVPSRTLSSTHLPAADPLRWILAVGDTSIEARASAAVGGQGLLFEDDGTSMAYRQGAGVVTQLNFTLSSTRQLQASIAVVAQQETEGEASDRRRVGGGTRQHQLMLRGVRALPSAASCNGQPLHPVAPGSGPGLWLQPDNDWSQDTAQIQRGRRASTPASAVLACPAAPASSSLEIQATW